MAAAGRRDERSCHICRDALTEPVSLPCGHIFCLLCIQESLSEQDESRFYTCPQCGKRFTARPSLRRITSEEEECSRCAPETSQVPCTYCVNPPAPAVRTCVQCEVSLCPAHLAAHELLGHKLVNATNSLENQKCSVHNRLLEYYCLQDSACICSYCYLLGEHRGHPADSLHEAVTKKKDKLKNHLKKLVSERKETRTTIERLHESLREEEGKANDVENQVISVFRDLQEQLQALEKKVLSVVSMQKSQVSEYYSSVISELRGRDKERSRSICDIRKTLRMTEPLSVLQQEGPGKAPAKEEETKKPPFIKEETESKKPPLIQEETESKKPPLTEEEEESKESPLIQQEEKSKKPPLTQDEDESKKPPLIQEEEESKKPPIIKEKEGSKKPPLTEEEEESKESPLIQEQEKSKKPPLTEEEEESKKPPLIREIDADLIIGNMYRSLTAIMTYNFHTDVKYIKEERTSDEGQCEQAKPEADSDRDSTCPECGDETICPVTNGKTYRLEMKSAGLFRCEYTGIMFQVEHPLTIEYEIDSWCSHMTQTQRDGCVPISHLFNIKTPVQPGDVSAVYLPHKLSAAECEVYKPYIKCVHYRAGKIILETPAQVDPSYVILEDPSFCCLGALIEKAWMFISSFFTFPGAVLMFGKKLMTKYLIHLYLVPDYESEQKEVIQSNNLGNGFHLFDVPAYVRNVCTKKTYVVSGPQGSHILPKELHFLFTRPSAQYPYSDIRIDNKQTSISLNIRESRSAEQIWECHLDDDDLERLSKPRKGPGSVSKIFIKKNYKSLCERLPLLPPILMNLRVRGVIDGDEEDILLRSTSPASVKNDDLLKMIVRKGAEDEFCNVLKDKDPRLVEDLERNMT